MAQDTSLHVKLDSETDIHLKQLAQTRGISKGQLVREAISACYQATFAELPLNQRQALAAYQGGYISLGKLAKVMGRHVLEQRGWLEERGIAQGNVYGNEDTSHA